MIKVPPRVAAMLGSLWAVGIGATTAVNMPWWGHYIVTAAGILLVGLGLIPTSEIPPGPGPPKGGSAEDVWE